MQLRMNCSLACVLLFPRLSNCLDQGVWLPGSLIHWVRGTKSGTRKYIECTRHLSSCTTIRNDSTHYSVSATQGNKSSLGNPSHLGFGGFETN